MMATNSDRDMLVSNELVTNQGTGDGQVEASKVNNVSSRTNLVRSPLSHSNVTGVFVVTFDTRSGEQMNCTLSKDRIRNFIKADRALYQCCLLKLIKFTAII